MLRAGFRSDLDWQVDQLSRKALSLSLNNLERYPFIAARLKLPPLVGYLFAGMVSVCAVISCVSTRVNVAATWVSRAVNLGSITRLSDALA